MKFAEHLSAHITPEWRKQYINYEVWYFGLHYIYNDEKAQTRFVFKTYTANSRHKNIQKKTWGCLFLSVFQSIFKLPSKIVISAQFPPETRNLFE